MKIIKFGANWCASCKVLSRVMGEMEIPYEVEDIDIDTDMDKVSTYGIRGIPTLVLLDVDGNVIKQKQGITTKKDVQEFLQ